jgi:hypothetical protein
MCSYVPNRGEQMVRYYGWYSDVARGKRLKFVEDDAVYGDPEYSWDAYITT